MLSKYDYSYKGDPQEFMGRVKHIPNLQPQEEAELIRAYQKDDDEQALSTVVAAYQKWLVSLIYKHKLQRVFGDALSYANIGFMKALKKFDADKGFRLTTYARWWVRMELQEAYPGSLVNLGSSAEMKRIKFNLSRIMNKVAGPYETPTVEHFIKAAEILKTKPEKLIEIYPVVMAGDASLDAPIRAGEDGGTATWADRLADASPSPEDVTIEINEADSARQRVSEAMEVLNERQRKIFTERRLRETPKTLQELADGYGLSKERVRQIEEQAFNIVSNYVRTGALPPPRNSIGRPRKAAPELAYTS